MLHFECIDSRLTAWTDSGRWHHLSRISMIHVADIREGQIRFLFGTALYAGHI